MLMQRFCGTEAVGNIISFLGMQPCERSDKVPENKNSHVLFLAGEFKLQGQICFCFFYRDYLTFLNEPQFKKFMIWSLWSNWQANRQAKQDQESCGKNGNKFLLTFPVI